MMKAGSKPHGDSVSVTVTSRNTETGDISTSCWSWYRCLKILFSVLGTQKVKLDSLKVVAGFTSLPKGSVAQEMAKVLRVKDH